MVPGHPWCSLVCGHTTPASPSLRPFLLLHPHFVLPCASHQLLPILSSPYPRPLAVEAAPRPPEDREGPRLLHVRTLTPPSPPPLFPAKGNPSQGGRPSLGPPPPRTRRAIKHRVGPLSPAASAPAPRSARTQAPPPTAPPTRVPHQPSTAHPSPAPPAQGPTRIQRAARGHRGRANAAVAPGRPRGAGRANMLAPRGAALLLLHLALQPWLGAGAQAPQGKWAQAAAGATGSRPRIRGARRPALRLGPRWALLCPSGALGPESKHSVIESRE